MIPFLLAACSMPGRLATRGRGPEDLDRISWKGGTALVTATSGKSPERGSSEGGLELFVPGSGGGFEEVRTIGRPSRLRPTGLCAVASSRDARWPGKQVLYVSNSAASPATVEVFVVEGDRIVHRGNLGPVPFPGPINGLAAHDDGTVYVSAFKALPGGDAPRIAQQQPPSRKYGIAVQSPPHHSRDAGTWSWAVEGMDHANGLSVSGDGRWLIACSYFSRSVFAFERNIRSGALEGSPKRLNLPLSFHPDNLKRSGDDLYELGGQRSILGSGLNLLTGLPVSPGGASVFRWDGHRAIPMAMAPAFDHAARRDYRSPSTALSHEGFLYFGHPRNRGVSRIALEHPPARAEAR